MDNLDFKDSLSPKWKLLVGTLNFRFDKDVPLPTLSILPPKSENFFDLAIANSDLPLDYN